MIQNETGWADWLFWSLEWVCGRDEGGCWKAVSLCLSVCACVCVCSGEDRVSVQINDMTYDTLKMYNSDPQLPLLVSSSQIDKHTPRAKTHTLIHKARMQCKSGLICQSSVSLLSVGGVWVSDERYECQEMSKCKRLCVCVRAPVVYLKIVCVFYSTCSTGVCRRNALPLGSFLMWFNRLIVSCGVCRDGALCVCICPISGRFWTNKSVSGCECFVATVMTGPLFSKIFFPCHSSLMIMRRWNALSPLC